MMTPLVATLVLVWFGGLAVTCVRQGRPALAGVLLASLAGPPLALRFGATPGALAPYLALALTALSLGLAAYALATLPRELPSRRRLRIGALVVLAALAVTLI